MAQFMHWMALTKCEQNLHMDWTPIRCQAPDCDMRSQICSKCGHDSSLNPALTICKMCKIAENYDKLGEGFNDEEDKRPVNLKLVYRAQSANEI